MALCAATFMDFMIQCVGCKNILAECDIYSHVFVSVELYLFCAINLCKNAYGHFTPGMNASASHNVQN